MQCAWGHRKGTLLVKAATLQRKPPGEGTAGHNAIRWGLETDGTRTWDRRTSGTGARVPAEHRQQLSYFLFLAPEGGGKTRLGGEVRNEEHLLPRAGMSTDRDGTDEDLSEGIFHMLVPLAPARPESHGTRGQARSDSTSSSLSTSPQRLEQAAYRED
jgi:hypothetical protein